MTGITREDELDQLRRDFALWEIAPHPELRAWIAEQRGERSRHVIVAYTLGQLRDKLTAERAR